MSSWSRRLAAGWLALWFALLSVDPGWLHACPMHGRGAVSAQQESEAPTDHGPGAPDHAAHGHAAHTEHAAPGHDAPATPSHDSHECACLGDCASATAGLAVVVPVTLPQATIVPATAVVPTPVFAVVTHRVSLVLPFATAPPARAS